MPFVATKKWSSSTYILNFSFKFASFLPFLVLNLPLKKNVEIKSKVCSNEAMEMLGNIMDVFDRFIISVSIGGVHYRK